MAEKTQIRTLIFFVCSLLSMSSIIALLALAIWSEHKQDERQPVGVTTGVGTGPGKYWHHGTALLPNPGLSPGEVRTTDLTVICGGNTKQFRHTSAAMKRRVYTKYDEAPHRNDCADTTRTTREGHEIVEACEVDHIIPLELGGADSDANLFPQPYNPPGGDGAHAKDEIENYLHEQVCTHGMSVTAAQKKIASDWYQIYMELHPK